MTPDGSEETRRRADGSTGGDSPRRESSRSGARELLVVALLGALPWVVLLEANGSVSLVAAWGLANPETLHVFGIVRYFSAEHVRFAWLPPSLQAWPVGVGFYALALASALGGAVTGREDTRVTAGLLVLAGVAALWVTVGFLQRGVPTALPVGTAGLWLAAWRLYGLDFFGGAGGD